MLSLFLAASCQLVFLLRFVFFQHPMLSDSVSLLQITIEVCIYNDRNDVWLHPWARCLKSPNIFTLRNNVTVLHYSLKVLFATNINYTDRRSQVKKNSDTL